MAFFNEFPYTRNYDTDLGWVIKKMIELEALANNIIELQTIKYADPIQWNITTQYQANTVVIDPSNGTAYISTKPVPSGVLLTDTNYWTIIFNYQRVYDKIMTGVAFNDKDNLTASKDLLVNDLVWYKGDLYRVTRAISEGSRYIVGTNITPASIESLLENYYGRDRMATVMNDTLNISGDYTINAGDIAETANNKVTKITTDKETEVDGNYTTNVKGTHNYTTNNSNLALGISHVSFDSLILGHDERYLYSGTDVNTTAFLSQFGLQLNDDDAITAGLAFIRTHGGTLIVDRDLTITKSIILHSNDKIDFNGHTVTVNGGVNGIQSEYVNNKAPVGIVIKNLKLNGNNVGLKGIYLNSSASTIENVDVTKFTLDGIHTVWMESESEDGRQPLENTYRNIRCYLNGNTGILFDGPHDSFFENVMLVSNSQASHNVYANFESNTANFRAVHMHSWNFASWVTEKRAAYAILLKNSQSVQISDSHFEGASTANVLLDGGRNVSFVNCHFYASYGVNDIIISAQSNMFNNCYISNYSSNSPETSHAAHIVFGDNWNVANYFNINFSANDTACIDEAKASTGSNMILISSTTSTASVINRKSGWYLSNNDTQHFGRPLAIYGNLAVRMTYMSNNTNEYTIPDTVGVIIQEYLSNSKTVNLPSGDVAIGTMIWICIPEGTAAGVLTFAYSGTIQGATSMNGTNKIGCLVKTTTTQWTVTVI